MRKKTLNEVTLAIFAPLLILTGIAGFLVPAEISLTSGAAPYNVFHIVFGSVGLIFVLALREPAATFFNLGFGLIDLYQVLASYLHYPPEQYFRWTRADDILHILIGSALVVIGSHGLRRRNSH